METVVLACNTIRDEIEKAALETNCPYPFTWIESGLHLVTSSLRQRLQEELDKMNGKERVLLGFGICGGALTGLKTGDYQLVIPRVDDCISLLLGSAEAKRRCAEGGGVYFLTRGWLEGEANIWKEYHATVARMGLEKTERVYRKMLAHYKFLGLIDTGAYDIPSLLPELREISSTLRLELVTFQGKDQYLRRLLEGPWDEDYFVVVPPFTTIDLTHLCFGSPDTLSSIQGGV
ncbi:MAG: DUF1638 domain-containing protein [Syntrophobacteraceae bacterium]|nr:DUF1638 domain-containing protein [Syntrophobacteraceae bacterium]